MGCREPPGPIGDGHGLHVLASGADDHRAALLMGRVGTGGAGGGTVMVQDLPEAKCGGQLLLMSMELPDEKVA